MEYIVKKFCCNELPDDKLPALDNSLQRQYIEEYFNSKELHSLIGSLNFACQVVTPGHAILRRLMDLSYHVSDPFKEINFTSKELDDIKAPLRNLKQKKDFHKPFLTA